MRKLVAALACRVQGTRLYGKPLQNLAQDLTILDHMIHQIKTLPEIDDIVLGISEGIENQPFVEAAKKHNLGYIWGDKKDVLMRLIQCGRSAAATDVFRVTSECPFICLDDFSDIWQRHVSNNNDVTVTDNKPEGTAFEIYSMKSLEDSHAYGNDVHRSEYCSLYVRENRKDFKVEVVEPIKENRRMDIRLTVDYPEDLVICRKIYEALSDKAPNIPLSDIISFMDDNPQLKDLVRPYVDENPLWIEK